MRTPLIALAAILSITALAVTSGAHASVPSSSGGGSSTSGGGGGSGGGGSAHGGGGGGGGAHGGGGFTGGHFGGGGFRGGGFTGGHFGGGGFRGGSFRGGGYQGMRAGGGTFRGGGDAGRGGSVSHLAPGAYDAHRGYGFVADESAGLPHGGAMLQPRGGHAIRMSAAIGPRMGSAATARRVMDRFLRPHPGHHPPPGKRPPVTVHKTPYLQSTTSCGFDECGVFIRPLMRFCPPPSLYGSINWPLDCPGPLKIKAGANERVAPDR
jgi:hypothetical protein